MTGPGPVDTDEDLAPEPGRDLPDRGGQHLFMAGERVRPGVARAKHHGQALAGVREPGSQRVEPVALLPGRGGALLVRAGGDQGGIHVDDQPPGQGLSGDLEPREPGGRVLDQLPGVRPGSRAGAGDLVQRGRRPGQVQGAPHRRRARCVPEHRGQVLQQGDVAHAGRPERDRGRQRDQHGAPVEDGRGALLPQGRAELPGQSRLVGGLAEQDRAGVADQPGPVGSDLQGMVPPVMLHGEERSSPGNACVVTANLPGPGALFALKAGRDGRFAAVPSHSRDTLIAPHPQGAPGLRPGHGAKPQVKPGTPPAIIRPSTLNSGG